MKETLHFLAMLKIKSHWIETKNHVDLRKQNSCGEHRPLVSLDLILIFSGWAGEEKSVKSNSCLVCTRM